MTLDDFKQLCDEAWTIRGDVSELHLTSESAHELASEVLMNLDARDVRMDHKEAARIAAGADIGTAMNPITRTMVKIQAGGEKNWALVSYGPWRPSERISL